MVLVAIVQIKRFLMLTEYHYMPLDRCINIAFAWYPPWLFFLYISPHALLQAGTLTT